MTNIIKKHDEKQIAELIRNMQTMVASSAKQLNEVDALKAKFDEYVAENIDNDRSYRDFLRDHNITTYKNNEEICKHIQSVFRIKKEQLTNEIAFIKDFDKLPSKPEPIVEHIADKIGYTEDWAGDPKKFGNYSKSDGKREIVKTRSELIGAIDSIRLHYDIKDVPDRKITALVEKLLGRRKDIRFNEIQNVLAYCGYNAEKAWRFIVDHYFDCSESEKELIIAILKQFIFQVKAKMARKPIETHLMPVLLGGQGMGKSYFISNILCKPLQELADRTTFDQIADARNADQFRYYVNIFDEMTGVTKADINRIKEIITSTTQSYRPMGTNTTSRVSMDSTFIGCSNEQSLEDLIKDTTGNRRFAPLQFRKTRPSIEADKAALFFDPIVLWQSVDIDAPEPILAFSDQLVKLQKKHVYKNNVYTWFEEQVIHADDNTLHNAKIIDLKNDYKDWCKDNSENAVMSRKFTDYLSKYLDNFPEYKISKNRCNVDILVKV